MKAKDLRNKSNKELQKSLADSRAKLAQLSVDYRTKEVKNVREIRNIKKAIARTLTIIAEQASASVTRGGEFSWSMAASANVALIEGMAS